MNIENAVVVFHIHNHVNDPQFQWQSAEIEISVSFSANLENLLKTFSKLFENFSKTLFQNFLKPF